MQAQKPKQLCRFFAQGTCTSGQNCRFSHDKGGAVNQHQQKQKPSQQICFHFQKGNCSKGEACNFIHPGVGGSQPQQDQSISQPKQSKKPCSFFAKGHCKHENCKFSHTLVDGTNSQQNASQIQASSSRIVQNQFQNQPNARQQQITSQNFGFNQPQEQAPPAWGQQNLQAPNLAQQQKNICQLALSRPESTCINEQNCKDLHILEAVGQTNLLQAIPGTGIKIGAVCLLQKQLFLYLSAGSENRLITMDSTSGQIQTNEPSPIMITDLVSMESKQLGAQDVLVIAHQYNQLGHLLVYGNLAGSQTAHQYKVLQFAINIDKDELFTIGQNDPAIKFWRLNRQDKTLISYQEIDKEVLKQGSLVTQQFQFQSIEYIRDTLVIGTDQEVMLVNLQSKQCLIFPSQQDQPKSIVKMSASDNFLAMADSSNKVTLYNFQSPTSIQQIYNFQADQASVTCLHIRKPQNSNRHLLMAGLSDGSLHFVLAEDPRILGKVPGTQQQPLVGVKDIINFEPLTSAEDSLVAAVYEDGRVDIWRLYL